VPGPLARPLGCKTYSCSLSYHPRWRGHASMVAEMKEQLPAGVTPRAVVVAVGGGGLLCGVCGGPGRLSHKVPISIQTRSKVHTITASS
jgi:threonine dehydratase